MVALRLTANEGAALAVLDVLLGISRGDAIRAVPELGSVRPGLALVATRHVGVTILRWLWRSGGYRERQLLRGDQRTKGRLWDAELNKGFKLHYTRASWDFWLNAAKHLPALGPRLGSTGETRQKHKRLLRDMVLPEGTRAGDWAFFALALRNLSPFGLDPDDRSELEKRLRRASPLAALFDLEATENESALAARFKALTTTEGCRLIECLEDPLVDSWNTRIETLYAGGGKADALTTQWKAHARVLRAFVTAADNNKRMDLARPVLRLLPRLLKGAFKEGGEKVRQRLASSGEVRSIAQRDELVAAVGEVLAVGSNLVTRREVLASERYGDERYEEAQIFLRMYQDEFAPFRGSFDAMYRGLSGAVG